MKNPSRYIWAHGHSGVGKTRPMVLNLAAFSLLPKEVPQEESINYDPPGYQPIEDIIMGHLREAGSAPLFPRLEEPKR